MKNDLAIILTALLAGGAYAACSTTIVDSQGTGGGATSHAAGGDATTHTCSTCTAFCGCKMTCTTASCDDISCGTSTTITPTTVTGVGGLGPGGGGVGAAGGT